MIRSFVSTVKWFAHNVTNRCVAILQPVHPVCEREALRADMRIAADLPPIPTPPPVTGIPGHDGGLPFDRVTFYIPLTVHALRIPPELCSVLRTTLRTHTLSLPRTQAVQKPKRSATGSETRPEFLYLLLRYLSQPPAHEAGNLSAECSTADAVMEKLRTEPKRAYPTAVADFLSHDLSESLCERRIALSYKTLSAEGVLRRLLPNDITVPTSFETVGNLIHLNLRPEHAPYKQLIGSVLLNKHVPRIRTVVNKTANTGGPYRTFQLEVLAGALDTRCTVRENGCTYTLDFAAVYWNSRLETEHRRIVDAVREGDVFLDLFAGIGPFAIPVARRGLARAVYANDLNPASIAYLARNARANGVGNSVEYSCGCARDYLDNLVRRNVPVNKVVMNFPAGAPEFLDAFRGLYNNSDAELPMPTVFCYCFVRDGMHEARDRVRAALFDGNTDPHATMRDDDIIVRRVRDVAPRKIQVCVTFTLPRSVAYAQDGVAVKKVKVMAA